MHAWLLALLLHVHAGIDCQRMKLLGLSPCPCPCPSSCDDDTVSLPARDLSFRGSLGVKKALETTAPGSGTTVESGSGGYVHTDSFSYEVYSVVSDANDSPIYSPTALLLNATFSADGSGQQLDWAAVAGASAYLVYRNGVDYQFVFTNSLFDDATGWVNMGIPDPPTPTIEEVNPSDGDAAYDWQNQGQVGSAGNALQAVAARRPGFFVGQIDGKPAVLCDPTPRYLQTAAIGSHAQATMALVFKCNSVSSAGILVSDTSGAFTFKITPSYWSISSGLGGGDIIFGGETDILWHCLTARFAGDGTSTFEIDGVSIATGNCGALPLQVLRIGGDESCLIAALDIWFSAFDDTQRAVARTALKAEFPSLP
jgi:hypothetical protein